MLCRRILKWFQKRYKRNHFEKYIGFEFSCVVGYFETVLYLSVYIRKLVSLVLVDRTVLNWLRKLLPLGFFFLLIKVLAQGVWNILASIVPKSILVFGHWNTNFGKWFDTRTFQKIPHNSFLSHTQVDEARILTGFANQTATL